MRISIIETGRPAGDLGAKHGAYPAMFKALLAPHLPAIDCPSWAALDGEALPGATDCQGYLITGSAYSSYEDLDWIPPLERFIRECRDAGTPLMGICFGHQIVAQALGGRVEKAEIGWGVGVHTYETVDPAPWMDGDPPTFSNVVSHQDQVVDLPAGAKVLARSDFCPAAALSIGDRIFTLQSHPEMSADFARDLYEFRRDRIGSDRIDAAQASLDRPIDADRVAGWIAKFFSNSM